LLLGVIAYDLGNLLRRLVLPMAIQDWSLTSLQQRLFKTGGRLDPARPVLHPAAGPKLLDRGALSADSPARRAAGLAPDVIGREPRSARSEQPSPKELCMSTSLGPGFHAPAGKPVDGLAYERWVGRWSRMFVPMVIAAAQVVPGDRILDVSTGTGEAAVVALQAIGSSGRVVGVDIAPAMLTGARERLNDPAFWPVAADGQALPFDDASFDAVVCQLGLQFFPDPARGLTEFRRVLRPGANVGVCVISTPDKAPMWGILAEELGRRLPAQRPVLNLSFALADQSRLHALFASAGFRDIAIEGVERHDAVESFDAYWEPIESGAGSIPQMYLTLPEADRRAVREEVERRLSRFEVAGKLVLSVEMLIGRGQA
jgi:SAM-dependent methyltransferase